MGNVAKELPIMVKRVEKILIEKENLRDVDKMGHLKTFAYIAFQDLPSELKTEEVRKAFVLMATGKTANSASVLRAHRRVRSEYGWDKAPEEPVKKVLGYTKHIDLDTGDIKKKPTYGMKTKNKGQIELDL